MSGLFGTFNIAKSGLFAQQRTIDVTSHNIANANTEGYSRQRAELQASRPSSSEFPGQMGTGVNIADINRIRDSFLDYQVRVEMGVNGQFTGRDKFLSEIENIMNEPSDTGMSTLIGKFFDSWHTLGTSAGNSNSKSMVAQQAIALTDDLNHSYSELQSLKSNTQTVIKDTVVNINSILGQINELNQQIMQVNIARNNPNDLMDRRDLLLDQLSQEFGINIDKKQFEGYNLTTSNEGKYAGVGDDGRPPLAADGTTNLNLVQAQFPNNASRFSYVNTIESADGQAAGEAGNYKITYYKNGDMSNDSNKVVMTVDIEDTGSVGDPNYVSAADKYKKLDECRVIWADNSGAAIQVDKASKSQGVYTGTIPTDGSGTVTFEQLALFQPPTGELKGYMSVQQDVDTYEDQLNKFAKALAFSVNGLISQSSSFRPDGSADGGEGGINNFFVNSNPQDTNNYTAADENGITAENITINAAILQNDGYMKIKAAASYDSNGNPISGENDGARALAIATLRDKLMSIQNINDSTTRSGFLTPIFKQDSSVNNLYTISNDTGGMTLDSYFKDTINRLGIQEQDAKRMVSNQATLLADFQESRDSVSGVSLDEEMANLVQFQHCYQANAKIISTVDQLLDVVVNGLKR